MTATVSSLKERLMAWAGEGSNRDEMVRARAEFFKPTGDVRDDEPCFEPFMDAFADWYLCDRAMDGQGTPAERFVREQGVLLPPEDLEAFKAFLRTRPGVFRLEASGEGQLRVTDLLTKEKLDVAERRRMVGVGKGDLFHARLLPMADALHFTGLPLFHPPDVRRQVLKVLRHARKKGPEAYRDAARELVLKRLKVDRYRHVAPRELYKDIVPRGLLPLW